MILTNLFNQWKHFLFITIFLLVVFILAIGIWYSPILFKGYSPSAPSADSILAHNLYENNFYSVENNINIVLSSSLVKDEGILSAKGNKLTPLLYSKMFDFIGLPQANHLILFSIFINALVLVIFTGLIFHLFNFKTAFVFSLVYILLPFNWQSPYFISSYEFALLFLSLFFFLFFYGLKNKYNYICLPISGIFLILACLSRESLFLIAPFLLLFLWFKKQKKPLFYIFIPFMIIFAIFWLPNVAHNSYLQLFTTHVSEQNKGTDFSYYGHIYPDPYTYHFGQEEFLTDLQNKIDNNEIVLMEELYKIKRLKNMGIVDISLFDRARIGLTISSRHIFRFVSLEDTGGPFILFLIFLGLYSLRQKNKYLYQFFIYWIISTIFLMSFIVLVGRNHLIDFNWAITLLISLGLIFLIKLFSNYFNLKKKKQVFLYIALLFIVIYHLILVNHVAWSRIYDNSHSLMIQSYGQEIKKLNINDKDIIAVGLDSVSVYSLNYLTNKSVVIFRSETVADLLEDNKLDWAFEQFGVKYILGYSDELTGKIINQTKVVNVASNSLKPIIPEMSRNKGWLMNLVN